MVKTLLQIYNANPNCKDIFGRTPMHLAVNKNKMECAIRIFIEGGKLNMFTKEQKSVKDMATNQYTRFLLEKLDEIRFLVRNKGITSHE